MNTPVPQSTPPVPPGPRASWAQRYARQREQFLREHRLRTLVDKSADADAPATRLHLAGRSVLNFGGNDYLGLAHDLVLLAAAAKELMAEGTGATGSRLLSGQRPVHAALEQALADLKHKPRALVFPSGYQAAGTLIATLCGLDEKPPRVLLDKLCHASLIDGARLAQAPAQRFKHNQPADLEKYLARHAPGECIVIVESIYSMDGDAAPLAALYELCRSHQALFIIDDAHATGVLGDAGAGLTAAFAADENVIVLGTLSKALGAQGGFIAAHEWVVDLLIQSGRGFLFTTGLAPVVAAAALAAVQRLPALHTQRAHLATLRSRLVSTFESFLPAGIHPAAAIVPIVIGADARAVAIAEALLIDGFYLPAVRPPTVPPGTARLRISLSAAHTTADLDRLIEALRRRLQ